MPSPATVAKSPIEKASLTMIINNWMSTLFAYQPEIYFQLDAFRRKLKAGFVSSDELHTALLKQGLLKIAPDGKNPRKLYLRLDADMFPESKGKFWAVVVKKNGTELEFSCAMDSSDGETKVVALLH